MVQVRQPDILKSEGHSVCTNTWGAIQDCIECAFIPRNEVWKFFQKVRQWFLIYRAPPSLSLLFASLALPFSFYHISNQLNLLQSEVNLTFLVLNSVLVAVESGNSFLKAFKVKWLKMVKFWGLSISLLSQSWI